MRSQRNRVRKSCVVVVGVGLALAVTLPGCSNGGTSERSPKRHTNPDSTAVGDNSESTAVGESNDTTSTGGSGAANTATGTSCRGGGWEPATVTGDWMGNFKFQPSCLSAGVSIEKNYPMRSRPKYAFHFNDKNAGSIEVSWLGSEDGNITVPTVGAIYDSEAWRTSTTPRESRATVVTARAGEIVTLGQPGTGDGEYTLSAVVKFLAVPQRDGDIIRAEITLSVLKPQWTTQAHPPVIATRQMTFTAPASVAWNVPH